MYHVIVAERQLWIQSCSAAQLESFCHQGKNIRKVWFPRFFELAMSSRNRLGRSAQSRASQHPYFQATIPIYLYIYIYSFIYIYIFVIYIFIYTYICTYIYMYKYIYIFITFMYF